MPIKPVYNPLARLVAVDDLFSVPINLNLIVSSAIPALDEKYLVPLYFVDIPPSTKVILTFLANVVGGVMNDVYFSI